MMLRRCVVAVLLAALASVASAQPPAPERPSGWAAKQAVTARHAMVAAANPLAAQAGLAMLERGGSAVDAAIAVQLVLTLVEPQSSGIGGGAFMLVYAAPEDGGAGAITAASRSGGKS